MRWRCLPAGLNDPAKSFSILPLYHLIRRPTYILDFSLTLVFLHLILTTYYSASFPTSVYFWVIQALGALFMITIAEQVSVGAYTDPKTILALVLLGQAI